MVEAAGWNVRRAVTVLRRYMVEAAGCRSFPIVSGVDYPHQIPHPDTQKK
jgi:hypothetical protein